jgi:hypothetical protein
MNLVLIPAKQQVEGAPISFLNPSNEFLVGILGHA